MKEKEDNKPHARYAHRGHMVQLGYVAVCLFHSGWIESSVY